MIASVSGVVAALAADIAVIEVGGVGLSVHCAPATLASLRIGSGARLATTLIVREDSLTLYGFADDDERQLFELLQTASGIGPRIAQAALAVHSPDVLRKALANGEVAVLVQIPGVGKKGAERLILELRDKVGPVPIGAPGAPKAARSTWPEQIRQALTGLGWSAAQAEGAVTAVAAEVEATVAAGGAVPPVQTLLRSAIRQLGPGRS
jgi:Holliday junction DNA helicase RuvA